MSTSETHYRKLERLYLAAPTNRYYRPTIEIAEGSVRITVEVREDFFHAARAVHGSVCFKLLDDAGYFAVGSLVEDVLVLTSSFTIHLLRPVSAGLLVASGSVLHRGRRQHLAEASLFDGDRRLVAHGSGSYVSSRTKLEPGVGYL